MNKNNKKNREKPAGIDVETLVVVGGALLSAYSILKPHFNVKEDKEKW